MGNFLFIEPFYGGSHKSFIDGLKGNSSHNIEILSLPSRFWKWRMRGSASYISELDISFSDFDGIIASNMLPIAEFKGLCGPDLPPIILYFHENQILYPLKKGEREDLHYGFTDYTSARAAEHILFNSEYHKNAFLKALPEFLNRFPDFKPLKSLDSIGKKSRVLYPGCHLDPSFPPKEINDSFPVIVWNHRWEHDKNPDEFFSVLFDLAEEGEGFKLIVLGEKFSDSPAVFARAAIELKDRIIHMGYAADYRHYRDFLKKGDIVISTSFQENFGISVVEAIGSGNLPLLPDRLSYSELIPERFRKLCLYKNSRDLYGKLKKLIRHYDCSTMDQIARENLRFSWTNMIEKYDLFLEQFNR